MTDIDYLNDTVWATLGPSKINGVGVIAIRDIPRGQILTDYSVHNINKIRVFVLKSTDFAFLHPGVRDLILGRTIFRKSQEKFHFYSPNYEQTLQSFMNHSEEANSDGRVALRDIRKGEEITEDYRGLTNGEAIHPLSKKFHKWIK